MNRLAFYAVTAILLITGLGGLIIWGREGHQQAAQRAAEARVIATQLDTANASLRAFKEAAEKDAKIARDRAVVAHKQQAAAAAQIKELRRALDDNPQWADARIPDSVRSALDPTPAPAQAAGAGTPAPAVPKAGGAGATQP